MEMVHLFRSEKNLFGIVHAFLADKHINFKITAIFGEGHTISAITETI